jgi:hypothetical protein
LIVQLPEAPEHLELQELKQSELRHHESSHHDLFLLLLPVPLLQIQKEARSAE